MKIIFILVSILSFLFSMSFDEIKKSYYKSYNYEKMGDYKDAIKVLIPVYKEYPDGYTINLRLAWLFFLDKKYQNAIKHYQKASAVLPESLEPKLGLMRVYNVLGEYNNTLKVGNVVLRKDYYNYYGNYYDIVALMGIGNFNLAKDMSEKMLNLYPTSVLFLTTLAKSYYYLGKKDIAKKIFNDILILDPNNIVAKEFLKK